MTRPRARLVLAASWRSAARRPSAGPAGSTQFCLEPTLPVCQSGRMTSPQKIARLAIALDEVKPPVRRRVEVQLAVRLDQLHRIIQIVMGWENYHLYEFRVGRDVVYGISYRDRDFPGTSPLPAKKATLADILAQARNKSFRYVYDIGDDWRHTVKLEAVVDAEPEAAYPRLLSAQGRFHPKMWEVRGAMPCTWKPWLIPSTIAMPRWSIGAVQISTPTPSTKSKFERPSWASLSVLSAS